MAKRKTTNETPVEPIGRTEDRHAATFMVRLEDVYREQLRALQERVRQRDKYRRAPSVTDLVRVAVENLLAEESLWPPSQS